MQKVWEVWEVLVSTFPTSSRTNAKSLWSLWIVRAFLTLVVLLSTFPTSLRTNFVNCSRSFKFPLCHWKSWESWSLTASELFVGFQFRLRYRNGRRRLKAISNCSHTSRFRRFQFQFQTFPTELCNYLWKFERLLAHFSTSSRRKLRKFPNYLWKFRFHPQIVEIVSGL